MPIKNNISVGIVKIVTKSIGIISNLKNWYYLTHVASAKEVMFFFCAVCQQNYRKTTGPIFMKTA